MSDDTNLSGRARPSDDTGHGSRRPDPARNPAGSRLAGAALAAALSLAALPWSAAAEPGPGGTGAAASTTFSPATPADTALLEGAVRGLLPDSLRTGVLVLGSTRLSQYSDRFRPELLDSLIGAVAAWGRDAIGVERDPPDLYRQLGAEEEPGYAPHYRIDGRIEPSSGRIDVELSMRWVPEAPTDTLTFLLHRDLGRPEIESDAVADVRVEPHRRFMKAFDADTSHTNRVTVALARTATPEEPVEMRWSYGGTLHSEHIRLGASLLTENWVELQVGSLWVPVAASLREPVTYDATVRLPEGYELVTGGAARRGEDGAYRISRAVPHVDVPLIASDRFRTERSAADGPPVTVYHAGAPDSLVSFVTDRTARVLSLYDDWLRTGRALDSLRVVIPPVPRARPNAYARPGLISLAHGQEAGRDVFDFLSHEAAHLWWSDAADTQSRHNFLNESFAEYTSFLAYREFYGEPTFEKLVERAREQSEGLPAIRDWSGKLNHSLMYRKGPWLLHRLHERMGEEAFLAFLRRLQRGSVGTLAGMIEALEETTDAETAAWFDRLLSE